MIVAVDHSYVVLCVEARQEKLNNWRVGDHRQYDKRNRCLSFLFLIGRMRCLQPAEQVLFSSSSDRRRAFMSSDVTGIRLPPLYEAIHMIRKGQAGAKVDLLHRLILGLFAATS
jgi:hypothetical protein